MILVFPKGSRKKLSRNFRAYEWDCKCGRPECDCTYIDEDLVSKLQVKRDEWKCPISLISGYRCRAHNRSKGVGGVKHSQHIKGRAADIVVYGYSPAWVHRRCKDFNGLGLYKRLGFVHVDMRPGHKARWIGR